MHYISIVGHKSASKVCFICNVEIRNGLSDAASCSSIEVIIIS